MRQGGAHTGKVIDLQNNTHDERENRMAKDVIGVKTAQ